MAYLLTILVDNVPFEAGDIISWRDENMKTLDGAYGFGKKTLEDERFKIVHVPDMTNDEANQLCRQQGGYNPQPANLRLGIPAEERNPDAKIRAYKFDINLLPSNRKAEIQGANKPKEQRYATDAKGDAKVMLDVENLNITKTEFEVAKILKPVVDNREEAFVREIT